MKPSRSERASERASERECVKRRNVEKLVRGKYLLRNVPFTSDLAAYLQYCNLDVCNCNQIAAAAKGSPMPETFLFYILLTCNDNVYYTCFTCMYLYINKI